MAATKDEIRGWLEKAKRAGATHLIVVCDTFDHSNYPVYVTPAGDARTICEEYEVAGLQKVMEVYSLARDIEEQLNETRAMHFD